jgi:hydroxymethylpyrimidine/phosphomethylpyrimidine kinase
MTDVTPERVKDLLESAINNSTEAWAAQSRYFDDLVKRNGASFAALSDARIESLKVIGESQTFNQAFEANIAYEQTVREALEKMHEENLQAWSDLQKDLSSVYTAADSDEGPASG